MTVANKAVVTFGLAGCTAVVQHVGRVLAALVAVCPRNAPVVPVLAEIFKYHLQICFERNKTFLAMKNSDIRQAWAVSWLQNAFLFS